MECAAGAARALVDRARDDLLPGAGLAEHEHRHVGRGDAVHAREHVAQAALGADDRLAELAAPEAREQRQPVGLGGGLLRGERAHAVLARERHCEGLAQGFGEHEIGAAERVAPSRGEQQEGVAPLARERRGPEIALEARGRRTRQALGEPPRAPMQRPPGPEPPEQQLSARRLEHLAQRVGGARGDARLFGERLHTQPRAVHPAHQEHRERKALPDGRGDVRGRLGERGLARRVAPDLEEYGLKALHRNPANSIDYY